MNWKKWGLVKITAEEFDNLIIYPYYQSVIMSEYVKIWTDNFITPL